VPFIVKLIQHPCGNKKQIKLNPEATLLDSVAMALIFSCAHPAGFFLFFLFDNIKNI